MTQLGQPTLRLSDTSMVSVALKLPTGNNNIHNDATAPMENSLNVYNDILNSNPTSKNHLHQVDSDDLPSSAEMRMNDTDDDVESGKSNTPFFKQLLLRMNPTECISPTIVTAAQSSIVTAVKGCTTTAYTTCLASDREEFESVLQHLLKDIKYKGTSSATTTISKSNARTAALQRLYRLTDREHAHNRVPAVCTTSFKTAEVLVTCLHSNVSMNDRRQTLLILNNLCIPIENKAALIFGEPFEELMDALLAIVRSRSSESYLALATLLNLSYIQDDHGKVAIYNYIPDRRKTFDAASQYGAQVPIDNPLSTIRTLESILQDYVPYVIRRRKVNSVELQCCRWSLNIIRNLISTIPAFCMAIGQQTSIPALSVQCLSKSDTTNLGSWTRDSIEDACLMILIHVCRFDECVQLLQQNVVAMDELLAICEEIKRTKPGIHQLRATALLDRLEESNCSQSIGYSV